jgi:hypothetical protein
MCTPFVPLQSRLSELRKEKDLKQTRVVTLKCAGVKAVKSSPKRHETPNIIIGLSKTRSQLVWDSRLLICAAPGVTLLVYFAFTEGVSGGRQVLLMTIGAHQHCTRVRVHCHTTVSVLVDRCPAAEHRLQSE